MAMIDQRELENVTRWANEGAPVRTVNLMLLRWVALATAVGLPVLLMFYT
jgi:hypothetical protein